MSDCYCTGCHQPVHLQPFLWLAEPYHWECLVVAKGDEQRDPQDFASLEAGDTAGHQDVPETAYRELLAALGIHSSIIGERPVASEWSGAYTVQSQENGETNDSPE